MTKERLKEFMPVMQGWLQGKTVQGKWPGEAWEDVEYPSWCENRKYRLKPELREFWIIGNSAYTLKQAYMNGDSIPDQIHVREVIEE